MNLFYCHLSPRSSTVLIRQKAENGTDKNSWRSWYVQSPMGPPQFTWGIEVYCNEADQDLLVARIAYLSSHVVFSIQPALAIDSDFSEYLHSHSAKRILGLVEKAPEVRRLDAEKLI